VLDNFPLATLREFIDWSPFFHTWGLKGIFPRIFDHPEYGQQAKQLYTEANALLDKIIANHQLTARGVYGLFPANAVGDDVELYADETRTKVRERFHFLRQQANREGNEPCRSLADFIAPKETGLPDHIGAFAVTSGICLKELCDSYRGKNDDYNAIMAEALADRLAEAFAECLHKKVREEWGYESPGLLKETVTGSQDGPRNNAGPVSGHDLSRAASESNHVRALAPGAEGYGLQPAHESPQPGPLGPEGTALSLADLIDEKYRGIRPAAGYPACPDHTEKGPLWHLLDVQKNTGMQITESFAMWPGSSVSGLYFAHPESRYFSLGKIDRDQVEDYAERKGMSVQEVERWLGPNLNYDPAG